MGKNIKVSKYRFLSTYVKNILESSFPQTNLYYKDKFIKFLESLGILMDMEHLEYFHRIGLIESVAKLHRPRLDHPYQKYDMVLEGMYSLQNYFQNGHLLLISGYEEWKNYTDGELGENAYLYYHPYQFISIPWLTSRFYRTRSPIFFEEDRDLNSWFQSESDFIRSLRQANEEDYKKYWIPRIGLLMLLDQPYAPYVKGCPNIWRTLRGAFRLPI